MRNTKSTKLLLIGVVLAVTLSGGIAYAQSQAPGYSADDTQGALDDIDSRLDSIELSVEAQYNYNVRTRGIADAASQDVWFLEADLDDLADPGFCYQPRNGEGWFVELVKANGTRYMNHRQGWVLRCDNHPPLRIDFYAADVIDSQDVYECNGLPTDHNDWTAEHADYWTQWDAVCFHDDAYQYSAQNHHAYVLIDGEWQYWGNDEHGDPDDHHDQ